MPSKKVQRVPKERVTPTLESVNSLVSKSDFPIFNERIHGLPLTYLDTAATSQKPQSVIDAEVSYYTHDNANVHRAFHTLAGRATEAYEGARAKVAAFIGGKPNEVVFTRNATEAINLVAASFVRPKLKPSRQIIVSVSEHHANFVPWQQLATAVGARLTVIPVDDDGQINIDFLEQALTRPTAILAVSDVSNVLGTVNPTAKIVALAKAQHVPVLVDTAQSLAHLPVNVATLGADFIVGSSHKLYGPTGVGFLWAKREHLETMVPYQFGGEMIKSVSVERSTWNDVPYKFEAGTPNIAGAIAFGVALDFIKSIGWDAIAEHEEKLLVYADAKLRAIPNVRILGPKNPLDRASLITFSLGNIPAHDLATVFDERGVAVRAGYHCAEPLYHFLHVPASIRASFGVYNDSSDIDQLIEGINDALKIFSPKETA